MKFAMKMDSILLEEIMSSSPRFKQINGLSKSIQVVCTYIHVCIHINVPLIYNIYQYCIVETINGTGGQFLDDEASDLVSVVACTVVVPKVYPCRLYPR